MWISKCSTLSNHRNWKVGKIALEVEYEMFNFSTVIFALNVSYIKISGPHTQKKEIFFFFANNSLNRPNKCVNSNFYYAKLWSILE